MMENRKIKWIEWQEKKTWMSGSIVVRMKNKTF
jgi:hypothetical protein